MSPAPFGENPYAGTPEVPAGAGVRAEPPRRSSESLPGGLLHAGARVQITYPSQNGATTTSGTVVDYAAVPAPYLALDRDTDGTRLVVFVGPGVTLSPAFDHPGLQ